MDKYEMTMAEMIEVAEIEIIINRERQNCVTGYCNDCKYFGRHNCSSTKKAEAIHNEGYRKVAEDEIVIKKAEYDTLLKDYALTYGNAYQWGLKVGEEKTAMEILQELKDNFVASYLLPTGLDLPAKTVRYAKITEDEIDELAKKYGIELE